MREKIEVEVSFEGQGNSGKSKILEPGERKKRQEKVEKSEMAEIVKILVLFAQYVSFLFVFSRR